MSQQNIQQVCSVCFIHITTGRNITDDFKNKIDNCPDREFYQDLKSGVDKLCSSCYNQIADSYRHQKSTINRIKKSNSSMDLMEIIDSRSNSPITLMETNNLVNLIEVIKTQKEELIYENKLNEIINQQITDIEISITDNTISMNKENFNQLIKLIIQKDLKIEALTDQNNQNNLISTSSNNLVQNYSFSQQLELLTTILLKYQRENNEYLLDPEQFQQKIESNEPKLKGFFNEMINALIPKKRLDKNIEKAKKQVVAYCYLLVGIRNKFANNFKLDLGLYLQSSGMTNSGINTLSNIGLSVHMKTIQRYKKDIAKNYLTKLNEYFELNVSYTNLNFYLFLIFKSIN
ncbi:hypothetical protein F8M41_012363 [Gigaspora margarita]|uniref:Uncharacterized protein n=1 Tax=Gigaspora margarita TaxID=4874 RepID=A0A8H4AT87_GIGMA|nr:hypothetical protein F8M41_012363 [Gigaspora margarita]